VLCLDINQNLLKSTRSCYLKGKNVKISVLFSEDIYSLSKHFHTEYGCCILFLFSYMSHSIIAFSRFFNVTSTVLTLIVVKIVASWEVTHYDPVEIYTIWKKVFLPLSKRKKIYTRIKCQNTERRNLRNLSGSGQPTSFFSLRYTRETDLCITNETSSTRRRLGVTLRHGYRRTNGLDKGVCQTNRKLGRAYHLTEFFFCEL
jgi:hypothetical protein